MGKNVKNWTEHELSHLEFTKIMDEVMKWYKKSIEEDDTAEKVMARKR